MTAPEGVFVLHLHAHLPDVRAPGDWAEDWYFGAVLDTYLPLLELAEGWLRDGVLARVSVSLSPPLVAMLEDPAVNARCAKRLHGLEQLARDREADRASPERAWRFFAELMGRRRHRFEHAHRRDLSASFRRLEQAGVFELSTSGATHGFFPFLAAVDPALVDAQVAVGLRRHERVFGRPSVGFWLPECGYTPGVDVHLARAGVGYFFVDAHAAKGAVFGTGAPLLTPAGAVAFVRDVECAVRVWSPETGYPTDPRYREFHRDLGPELDLDVLARAGLPVDGRPLGIKLHRITDRALPALDKEPYDPADGQRAAEEHADDFVAMLAARAEPFARGAGQPAIIVAPYDAELFGHWWFEGPTFLDRVIRSLAAHPRIRLASPSDVVRAQPRLEEREPAATSWGRGGHASTWLTPENHWVQDRVGAVSTRMVRAARARAQNGSSDGGSWRLDAMAAEALAIAASDWPFLMTAGTFSDYATRRVDAHGDRFDALERELAAGAADPGHDLPAAPVSVDVSWRAFLGGDSGGRVR